MTGDKKIKIEFAPGCFDNLDMTQEELDKFVAELQAMAESGELFEKSTELDEDAFNALDPEEQEVLMRALQQSDETDDERKRRLN